MFKDLFSFQRLNQFFNVIYKIIIVQILLTVFNLPLAFSNLFIAISKESILVYVLCTITLLPSLVAIFTALRQIQGKNFEAKYFITKFWQTYTQNFKQNVLFALIFTALFELMAFDYFYVQQLFPMRFLFILLALAIFVLLMLYLATSIVLSYFQLSFKDVIKDAVYLSLTRFLNVASSVFLAGGLFILTKTTNWGILQLTLGGITAVYLFFVLGKVLELEAEK